MAGSEMPKAAEKPKSAAAPTSTGEEEVTSVEYKQMRKIVSNVFEIIRNHRFPLFNRELYLVAVEKKSLPILSRITMEWLRENDIWPQISKAVSQFEADSNFEQSVPEIFKTGISKTQTSDFDANLSYRAVLVDSYQFLWHSQIDANFWGQGFKNTSHI
jgi:hypothetical protein